MGEQDQLAAQLEGEVTELEERCTRLAAALKAAATETDAARDPAQFSSQASWWWQRGNRQVGDGSALVGVVAGVATGWLISFLVSLLTR